MTKTLPLPKRHLLLLLAIFTVNCLFAQTIRYVNANLTSGSNNGASWANAYKDLQPALAAAQNGDQIWVAKGTYYPTTSTTDRTAFFVMKNNLAIYGGFAGTETLLSQRNWTTNVTTLSGDIDYATDPLVVTGSGSTLSITGNAGNSYNVIKNDNNGLDATAILDGLSVRGGNASANDNSNRSYGGGMVNFSSSPSLANLVFSANSTQGSGGGMYNALSTLSLTNCMFFGNKSYGTGGGVYDQFASPSFVNCVFLGNSAAIDAGGIETALNYHSFSSSFINCIFSNNSALGNGGAMYAYTLSSASPIIINCIFTGNSASSGSAIYNGGSSPILQNSIIWGNADGIYNSSGTITVSNSNIQGGYAGTGNINQDPLFVNAASPAGADGIFGTADDGLKLQTASPCINTGNNAAIPTGVTTDITGLPRIAGGTVDMGAYEIQTAVLPLQLLNFNGNRQGNVNLLQWTTTNEVGIKTFTVESSINGNSFIAIGYVAATGGGKYSFADGNISAASTYYRLKMMDADGKFTYSNIIWISKNTTNSISLYPNPVLQTTTLNIGNNLGIIGTQAILTDAGGRLIKVIDIAHNQEQLDMISLPTGLYILKLKDGDGIKIVKQ